MDYNKFRQAKAIEAKNKKRLLEVNPHLNEGSGIYFLTRTDENGFKYAYVGQAVHILTRLAQHMVGYQHIDLSIKKHGLYSKQNQNGWKIDFNSYPEVVLNEMEQLFIKEYADRGYQLRNKTSGKTLNDVSGQIINSFVIDTIPAHFVKTVFQVFNKSCCSV